jgi:phage shock protein E
MYKKILFILVLTLFLTACSNLQSGTKISPEDAKQMLDSNSEIILLDVRTAEEYRAEHIPGSILITLSTLESRIEERFPNKSATYIVYCRSGNRSADAVKIMVDLGYQNVYDLGGIIDWPYTTQALN